MTDLKISEMDFKAAEKSFMVPVVDPSNLSKNYYTLAALFNFTKVYRWDADSIYVEDDYVIYESSTVKGVFRVLSTTSAGDAPEGAGAPKFKSVSLEFVVNTHTFKNSGSGNSAILSAKRTIRVTINTELFVSNTDLFHFSSDLTLTNMQISGTINSSNAALLTFYKNSANTFVMNIVPLSGSISAGGCYVDITIHG